MKDVNSVSQILSYLESFPRTELPRVIALCGGSCTGKSRLSRILQETLGDDAVLLPQDNFQLGEDFSERESSPYRWDDPRNFAPQEVCKALECLVSGTSTTVPIFDLRRNCRVGSVEIKPRSYILFEGLYTLERRFAPYINFGIYSEAPFYVRFLRRIFRFTREVDSSLSAVPVRHMATSTRLAHDEFVRALRANADLIYTEGGRIGTEELENYTANRVAVLDRKKPDILCKLPYGLDICVASVSEQVGKIFVRSDKSVIFTADLPLTVVESLRKLDWHAN